MELTPTHISYLYETYGGVIVFAFRGKQEANIIIPNPLCKYFLAFQCCMSNLFLKDSSPLVNVSI